MEATQYQALIKNDWLFKTNMTLDWNTHELQLSQNEAYQVLWTDIDHNKLLPILAWDNNDNEKEKQRKELTWEATIDTWTDNNQSKIPPILDWKENNKKKEKKREENIPEETTTAEEITSGWEREYSHEPIKKPPYISLKYKNCGKKLSSMRA
ncbi:hypothetical protein G9A89_020174 [Geosiphon pyriformis]|nr:hypothetical protein G9A89_020174 [Geosiphon pyriformis]